MKITADAGALEWCYNCGGGDLCFAICVHWCIIFWKVTGFCLH